MGKIEVDRIKEGEVVNIIFQNEVMERCTLHQRPRDVGDTFCFTRESEQLIEINPNSSLFIGIERIDEPLAHHDEMKLDYLTGLLRSHGQHEMNCGTWHDHDADNWRSCDCILQFLWKDYER